MFTSDEDLIAHVAGHAGLHAGDEAGRATGAVLAAFGSWLTDETRALVAAELPAVQAAALLLDSTVEPIEPRVAWLLGVRHVVAREIVASVCRVLAEELSMPALDALREELPAPVASFLASSESAEPEPPQPRGRRLSEARPGSEHPLSEARPDRTQSDSVAASNPHGEGKVSAGHVEADEPVAEGKPGAARPISGGRW